MASDVEVRLRVTGLKMTADLKRIENRLKKSMAKMRKQSATSFRRIGQAFALVGGGLAVRGALKPWMDYEAAMSNVAAKTGELRSDLSALDAEIRNLAKTSRFTTAQVGEAAGFLAMAGMDKGQIQDSIKSTLDLAAATRTAVDRTADILTNIATPLDLLDKAGIKRTADTLAKVASDANVSLEELGESASYAAPEFKLLGLSLEEGLALMGVLGDNAIKGSRGGVVFRQMSAALLSGADDTGKALGKQAKVLDKYGIKILDSSGELRNMIDILHEFKDKLKDVGDTERDTAIFDVFGARAKTSVSTWLAKLDDVEAGVKSAYDHQDEASTQAKVQMDNLEGDILALQSMFADVRITFAENGIGQLVRSMMQGITAFLDRNQKAFAIAGALITTTITAIGVALVTIGDTIIWVFEQATGPLFPIIAAGATLAMVASMNAAGAMLIAFGAAMVSKLVAFKVAMIAVKNAMIAFMAANPIGLIVAAIVAAIAIFLKFEREIKAAVLATWDVIKFWFGKFAEFIGEVFESVKLFASTTFDWIGGMISTAVSGWVDSFMDNFPLVGAVFESVKLVIAEVINWIGRLWDEMIGGIMEGVKWITDTADSIKKKFSSAGDGAKYAMPENTGGGTDPGEDAPGWLDSYKSRKEEGAGDATVLDHLAAGAQSTMGAISNVGAAMMGLDKLAYGGGAEGSTDFVGPVQPTAAAPGTGGDAPAGDAPPGDAPPGDGAPPDLAPPSDGGGLFARLKSGFGGVRSAGMSAAEDINTSFNSSLNDLVAVGADTTQQAGELMVDMAQMAMAASGKAAKFAKALAIGESIWNAGVAITKAWGNPYPKNIAIAAMVAIKTLMQIKKIKSTPVAQAHGGLTNVPETGSYWLESGERVLSRHLNQDLAQFIKNDGAEKKSAAPITNNVIHLKPSGMYRAEDIADAFSDGPGHVMLNSEVR